MKVINSGTIVVTEAGSIGIVAQSVGGGGGSAGFTGQVSYGMLEADGTAALYTFGNHPW